MENSLIFLVQIIRIRNDEFSLNAFQHTVYSIFFQIYILVALRFLDEKYIIHCNLKSENVLLSGVCSEGGLPQVI